MARKLTEDEQGLLNHVMMWGSDGYPVRKYGRRHWVWGPFRSISGPATVFKTKWEAMESFERYVDVLLELAGEEAWQRAVEEQKAGG